MTTKRIALLLVVLAAVFIVVAKASTRSTSGSVDTRPSGLPSRPAVILVADPREADSDCGCGEIIRRVRAAKARGVAVEEVAPTDGGTARRYGVTVAPTVVFLDVTGKIVARREGESAEVLAAISADLSKLEESRR